MRVVGVAAMVRLVHTCVCARLHRVWLVHGGSCDSGSCGWNPHECVKYVCELLVQTVCHTAVSPVVGPVTNRFCKIYSANLSLSFDSPSGACC